MRLDDYSYMVKVFGCQMNKHDGERVCGMLESLGASLVKTEEDADIIVYLTCCVREAADVRALGQIASLKNLPSPKNRRIVAVGGCIGQRDGARIAQEIGPVDIVFGTHNIAHLPDLIAQSLETSKAVVEVLDSSSDFSADLPTRREHPWHAWVPITIGCNNFCSYCIVPYVRGREKSRPIEEISSELDRLADAGVLEVTLLGQNVNSYGHDLYGEPRFAEVLECAAAKPLKRIRFATSHPKDLSEGTIEAMAGLDTVMPYLHLPVQSGSDRILAAMNRHYTASQYLGLIEKARGRVGDIAFSTDIIVGFPGEEEADFEATMQLCREVGYSQAFTFIYSKREGTPAARLVDNTPHEVIQERFDRLVQLIQQSAYDANQKDKGSLQNVLIEGLSKRDSSLLVGRTQKNQVVHAPIPASMPADSFVGTLVDVRIEEARTWYLLGSIVGR